jgi:tetratricopeptide (TPR) repeat protein
LVVKIAADGDNGETGKSLFIGREKEINEIIDDVKSNRGTRLLLVGESGIGKSALLDEVYRRLTEGEEENERNRPFVGYYSKKESLIAESESLLYPFSIVLKSLINSANESQQLEKIDSTMARVKNGLLKFGKEQGIKIGVAIIEGVANKVGLGQTLEVGKDILKAVGSEKTSLMLAQQYIADHRDEARQSYIEIFKAIADEFKERRFILIFDQFESVGKASTDFFLNFVKFLMPQERFDIIVSFSTDDTTWNDSAARKVYEDLERKMTYDLNAKKISIEGLSAEDIGKWIKQVRGMSLPLVPDLQRIRENSAGFPMLLGEWIKSSNDLKDYDKIKREKLCTLIIGLEDGLEDEQDQVRLDRMSILPYPLKLERLATYLQMNGNVDLVTSFVKRLSRYRIFDQDLEWFRHELIRRCFEDRLGNQRRSGYHQRAAEFFERLIEEEKQRQKQREQGEEVNIQNNDITNIEERYSILMSCAYHLDMSGGTYHEKSFTYNKLLAIYASKIGDLDIAERCYKRAIFNAEYLGHIKDKMECLYYMTRNGYDIWGRYEEAASNYQSLLKYYDSINDSRMRVSILSNIAIIHAIKGEHEQAMDLFKDNLETAREIGDQELISGSLNNIALIHDNKAEYDQALSCTTKAWRLQARWEISKE